MKTKQKSKYSTISNLKYIYLDIVKNSKLLFVIILIGIVSSVLLPLVGIYIPKQVVEVVINKDNAEAFKGFCILIVISTILTIVEMFYSQIISLFISSFQRIYLKRLLNKYLTCDYSVLESSDGQTKYRKALNAVATGNDYGSGIPCMIFASINMAIRFLGLFIYTGMLTRINPVLAVIIIVLSIIDAYSLRLARAYENSRRPEYGNCLKRSAYLERAAADAKAGKDMRIFNMGWRFSKLWDEVITDYKNVLWACKKHHADAAACNAITTFLRSSIAYGYLIYLVSIAEISVADFVLYFGAVSQFSNLLRAIAYQMFRMNLGNIQVSELREFLDIKAEKRGELKLEDTLNPPKIEFRNVTFTYKGADKPTLENINLTILPKEKIAIVGTNGAGKTTIVKLMCGFYLPTKGDILINGISTKDIDKEELIKLYSVIFQESVILPFTVAENVSMSSDSETDKKLVEKTINKANLSNKLEKLPNGIESQMTKELYEEGVILSGGEQQKLFMARALYKGAPILIMDEPTAALDPIAESKTYEQFDTISKEKTAIYISHRLASTRFCDRIILISGKQIAEIGSHDELLNKKGEYAKMFEVQKKYYEEVE